MEKWCVSTPEACSSKSVCVLPAASVVAFTLGMWGLELYASFGQEVELPDLFTV